MDPEATKKVRIAALQEEVESIHYAKDRAGGKRIPAMQPRQSITADKIG
jgi:hypothetical protein